MIRSLAIFVAFALISPSIRGYITDAFQTIDQLVQAHTITSYVITGLIGSASFLAVRLSKN